MRAKIVRFFKNVMTIAFVSGLLLGCYPKGAEYYSDLDLTVTDHDPDYDFGDQKSYFMADTVEYITNIKDDEIDPDDVEKLLASVEGHLNSRDYVRLDESEADAADFVITVSVIASKNTGVGWIPSPPYYPGWPWGPGWGGWYPPYWGGYYSYSYTTGSVIINWWDPQESAAPTTFGDDLQPVHWVAAFNGLVSSSKQNNSTRISAGLDQAFDQSEYIQSNK